MGPPSQGAAAVHTTPIAVPISVTIGEPDTSLRMLSAGWVIHSGPPKWRIVQENHRRPSSDNSRAGTQKLTGCRREPPTESAAVVSISALYSSVCALSGEPSTAMSAIGSTKRHRARARLAPEGSEERSVVALLGPEKGLGRWKERQAVHAGDDEALARTLDYKAASATSGDDTCCQHLEYHGLFFNLDHRSLMLDDYILAERSILCKLPMLMLDIGDAASYDVTTGMSV